MAEVLESLPSGSDVLIDTNNFIYGLTARLAQFLETVLAGRSHRFWSCVKRLKTAARCWDLCRILSLVR
jgi:hypothetical protein